MHVDDHESTTHESAAAPTAEQRPLEYCVVRVMHNKTSIMVTVPKVWARALHWEAGDHVRQELHEGNLLLINLDAPGRLAALRARQEGDGGTQSAS